MYIEIQSTGALHCRKRWEATGNMTSLQHWRSKKVAVSSKVGGRLAFAPKPGSVPCERGADSL